jgi:hypothetical protein
MPISLLPIQKNDANANRLDCCLFAIVRSLLLEPKSCLVSASQGIETLNIFAVLLQRREGILQRQLPGP